MTMKKLLTLCLAISLFAPVARAGETSTLLKTRASSSASVTLGKWQSNFTKAKAYAESKGVPFVAVWSNGDVCPHCTRFASACNSSAFKNWMKTSGMVFWFGWSGDRSYPAGSSACEWARKGKTMTFPFVRLYWKKGKVDVATEGDYVTGFYRGTTGGKNASSYIKKKFSAYKYNQPYKIAFVANGGTGSMATVSAKYGVTLTLPKNAFVRTDCAFLGWAKSATGSVVYKNGVKVKNLTSVKDKTVSLYARWRRTTFRIHGIKKSQSLSISSLKGWTATAKVPGLSWSSSKGKMTGKPTKAGTFKIKFRKGASVCTRTFIVD